MKKIAHSNFKRLDGNFILHKADVKMGKTTSSIIDNEFVIDGKGLKFKGSINESDTLVVGKWFSESEDGIWNEFIELKLQKQN